MAFGKTLRIILWRESSEGRKLVATDVIDKGDRFANINNGFEFKKQYMKYVEATPEKEQLIAEMYKKEVEFDRLKMATIAKIFEI